MKMVMGRGMKEVMEGERAEGRAAASKGCSPQHELMTASWNRLRMFSFQRQQTRRRCHGLEGIDDARVATVAMHR